jgi:RHS repeat-associated protein
VTLPDGQQISYVVDGDNRRIGKRVNGTLVEGFLYQDDLRPVAHLDGDGALVSQFVYATRPNVPDYLIKAGRTYRIIADHVGSPRLVVDTVTGEVVQQLSYDAFGRVLSDSNPGFQPFGFAGGLYDPATGLTHFGLREYDAEVGRWLTKDPIGFAGGDTNLYRYAYNDPVNFVDMSGEVPIVPILVGAATGAAIDIALQLWQNEGRWECIDWGQVGRSAIIGGVLGGIGGKAARSQFIRNNWLRIERGSWKMSIGKGRRIWKNDRWHAHFDPLPKSRELMRWHLPYERRAWWNNLKNIVNRRLRR